MTQERTRPVQTGTQGRGLFVGIGAFVALGLAGWLAILAVEGTEVVDAPMSQTVPTAATTTVRTSVTTTDSLSEDTPTSANATVLLRPSSFAEVSEDKPGFEGQVDHRPNSRSLTVTAPVGGGDHPLDDASEDKSTDAPRPTLAPEAVAPEGSSRKDLALLASVRAKHGDSLRNLPRIDPRTGFVVSFSGPPQVTEEDIKRVLSSHRPHVQMCAAAQKKRNEPVAGTIEVTFTVSPDGTIRSARTTGGTVDNLRFRHCVIFKIGRLTWPTKLSADLDVKVTYQVP